MIEYLLPRALVSRTKDLVQTQEANMATASPFASAIATSFAHISACVHQAVRLSLPNRLLGLLPSAFLLQAHGRVVSQGGATTLKVRGYDATGQRPRSGPSPARHSLPKHPCSDRAAPAAALASIDELLVSTATGACPRLPLFFGWAM